VIRCEVLFVPLERFADKLDYLESNGLNQLATTAFVLVAGALGQRYLSAAAPHAVAPTRFPLRPLLHSFPCPAQHNRGLVLSGFLTLSTLPARRSVSHPFRLLCPAWASRVHAQFCLPSRRRV